MTAKKIEKRKILVTDYDQCAIAYNGTDEDMISFPFMNFAAKKPYEGFYGCTHRCYRNMKFVMSYGAERLNKEFYTESDIARLATTVAATKNIEAKTGLPSLGVSTFEDTVKGKSFGQGYREIIQPYEEHGIKPKFKEGASFYRFVLFNLHSKNKQLTQIAADAAKLYPNEQVTLHYVEDNSDIINNAFNAPNDKNWPANVKIKFFWHSAKGDSATIHKVRSAEELQALQQFISNLDLLDIKKNEFELRADNGDENYRQAYIAADAMHRDLTEAGDIYFASKPSLENYLTFKTSCEKTIAEHRTELDKHRGCTRIILNILAIIGTLGIGYGIALGIGKLMYGNKFSYFNTESAKIVNAIDESIDKSEVIQITSL